MKRNKTFEFIVIRMCISRIRPKPYKGKNKKKYEYSYHWQTLVKPTDTDFLVDSVLEIVKFKFPGWRLEGLYDYSHYRNITKENK